MTATHITKKDYEYLYEGIKGCIMTSDTSYFIALENEDYKRIKESYWQDFISSIYHTSLKYHQIFSIAKSDLEFDFYSENASKFADSLTQRVFNDLLIFYPLN